MSWETWGYGSVDVPIGPRPPYWFPFQAVIPTIEVHTEDVVSTMTSRYRLNTVWPAPYSGAPSRHEIIEFEVAGSSYRSFPASKTMSDLVRAIATHTAQYTAAHMLSNIATIIANYPMSPEAKNQIIAALVMALPNFDDSEAPKSPVESPVGRGLVRTREDFMHAAVSARFRHRTTLEEYKEYGYQNKWDAT